MWNAITPSGNWCTSALDDLLDAPGKASSPRPETRHRHRHCTRPTRATTENRP